MRAAKKLLLPCLIMPFAAHAEEQTAQPAAAYPGAANPASATPMGVGLARGAPPAQGWTLSIGAAALFSPVWNGSRTMALSIVPDLRVNYNDTLFASIPDGLGWNAINADGWKAGPIAKIRFGRNENTGGSPFLLVGESTALRGMGDVRVAGEVGGFAEKRFGAKRQWRARAELRKGFGGHRGVVGDVSMAYLARSGRTMISVGPRATFASANYLQTYFGVNDLQAQRTGLATYRADGGLVSYGLSAALIRPLGRRRAVTVFSQLDRLGGEAGQSSLIRERGQRTQFTLGVSYSVRFKL